MIIVLKGADFSERNIGHVDVPIAEVVSISIVGNSNIEGKFYRFKATAIFDDGSSSDITSKASWRVSDGGTINAGLLTVSQTANNIPAVIAVDYRGKTSTMDVTITYQVISSETRALLTAYGRELSVPKQEAVEEFLTTLNNAEWRDKVKVLIIPMLCKEEEYTTFASFTSSMAVYNIIDKEKLECAQSTNIYGTTYGYYKITSDGLTQVLGHANFGVLAFITKYAIEATDCTCITVKNNIGDSFINENYKLIIGKKYLPAVDNTWKNNHVYGTMGVNGAYKHCDINAQKNIVRGISYKKVGPVGYGYEDGSTFTPNMDYNNATEGILDTFTLPNGDSSQNDLRLRLFTLCDFMEQAEIKAYGDALKALVDALIS